MKRFASLMILPCLLIGCSQAKNVDEQIQVMESRAQTFRDMGITGEVYGVFPMRVGWYTEMGIGSNGVIFAVARVHPQDTDQPTEKTPK